MFAYQLSCTPLLSEFVIVAGDDNIAILTAPCATVITERSSSILDTYLHSRFK